MSNLPKTMKALVAYGPGDYRLETEHPVPVCGPDDIIIKTEGCGVCVSDVKCYHGAGRYWGSETEKAWVEPPFIPGHEFLGFVAEIGENVKGFEIGDRITADQILPCGECRFCKSGRYWMCQPHKMFGYQNTNDGGMAEYVRYPKTAVISRVPKELPREKALLIEPYACSKHAVDRAGVTNEDILVIAGAGTLGLGMITYARMKNPAKLVVVDMIDERLEKAKDFGADIVINPSKEDAIAKIMELTDGYGCDIYIEATGHPSSVKQGLAMVRKLGTFVEFGVFAQETSVDWSVIGDGKELNVLGSHISPYCYPFVIEHMTDGSLKTDGLIKRTFPIEKWEEAFEYASGKYGDFKVAITFD
ncbi:GroES-like protein [Marvinbryantia formatexigens DSM 14469]|uniref:GroES-like protein n=1 Tax=Marvinbryantia formatexigens DSM 14469 TaxID=478749 RepID=C6L8S0_9FIRM|nr:erythritol/L-threitol dehydrogenase [Marvinbryantia formatexigens]EET62659.1 GroES-like protein [Marvinbryantia formatexigens DSM 14469]UWO23039.1 erythritol/L-threitol dehydrogenase [Marvinbryantia formatexigens DSM 14469]SDF96815.1 L-iditol 2-dehydrogenase [Marvinbryantia formatexigens]